MSEKLEKILELKKEKTEQIEELQKELFVEEHGVTREQANKLNKYLFHEPMGEQIDFLGRGFRPDLPVSTRFELLQQRLNKQAEEVKNLKSKERKLLFAFCLHASLSSIAIVSLIIW